MKHAEHTAQRNSVHNFARMKQFITLCELGIYSYYKANKPPPQTDNIWLLYNTSALPHLQNLWIVKSTSDHRLNCTVIF